MIIVIGELHAKEYKGNLRNVDLVAGFSSVSSGIELIAKRHDHLRWAVVVLDDLYEGECSEGGSRVSGDLFSSEDRIIRYCLCFTLHREACHPKSWESYQ